MGAAVQLLDAIVSKLQESTFGTTTFSRELLPEVGKSGLEPNGLVVLQMKENFEQDRHHEMVQYTVGVGLNYPMTTSDDLETALDQMEDIQDWLTSRANKDLVTASGTFKHLHPALLEVPFDSTLAKEGAVFFSVLTLKYLLYKNRS